MAELNQKRVAAGRAGGLATKRKYGRVYFQDIGKKGGQVLHARYKLEPVGMDDFALVHRETGIVKAFLSGRSTT